MVKRKYGDRSNWPRILERRYAQTYLDDKGFKGYVSLIDMVKVKEPLVVTYGDNNIYIVDEGYKWLLQFPFQQNHSVTTTFDTEGNIVQWYIDICVENGVEDGIPYTDDLFLDIVVLPTGEVLLLDEEELEEALASGVISIELYELAWEEAKRLIALIQKDEFTLLSFAQLHKNELEVSLEGRVLKSELE